MPDLSRSDAIAKLRDLVGDFRIAMLTTLDDDGAPWNRPMALQEPKDFDGTLHFFTAADSEKVAHVQRNPRVGVAFAKPDDQDYIAMAGTATVSDDRDRIREFWSTSVRAWFPDGPDDPNLRLLDVEVDRAEFWDSPSSAIAHVYSLAKAAVTGEPADDVGEHAKVSV